MGKLGRMFHGKPVYDAQHPITVTVNETDIRGARRKNPSECAIARCLIRDKHVESARVGAHIALIEFNSHYERFSVASAVKTMIRDFDETGTFTEGEYKLQPIPNCMRLTGKDKNNHRDDTPKRKSGPSGLPIHYQRPTRNIYRAKE